MNRVNSKASRMPLWGMIIMGILVITFIAFIMFLSNLKPGRGELDRFIQPADKNTSNNNNNNIQNSIDEPLIPPPPSHVIDNQSPPEEDIDLDFYKQLPKDKAPVIKQNKTKKQTDKKDKKDKKTQSAKKINNTKTFVTSFTPGFSYILQAGSFKSIKDADTARARILLLGLNPQIKTVKINGIRHHRVLLGPFSSSKSLHFAQQKLGKNGHKFMTVKLK
jgi:cell division protein FtsN